MENKLQYLLKKIHHYYPIGIPSLYKNYDGYVELTNMLEAKIMDIQNENDVAWLSFIREFKKKRNDFLISNFSHLQFPNYLLKIELTNHMDPNVEIIEELVICLSLLIPFYTIFTLSRYKVGGFEVSGRTRHELLFAVRPAVSNEELLLSIHGSISTYFKGYEYMDYKIPFGKVVRGGVPYGFGQEYLNGEFTVYDYLFSNDLIGLNYRVYYDVAT